MPPFDFPASPATGDTITGPYGELYRWDGVRWSLTPGGGGGAGGPFLPLAGGTVTGNLAVNGNTDIGGTLQITGNIVSTGNVNCVPLGAEGVSAGDNGVFSTGNIGVQFNSQSGVNNGIVLWEYPTAAWQIVATTGSVDIGPSTQAGAFQYTVGKFDYLGYLRVMTEGLQPGGGMWGDSSDIRLKRDVEDYKTGLEAVLALHPISFCFNGSGGSIDNGVRHIGLIADEAETVMPEMVGSMRQKLHPDDVEETDIKMLNATALTYALVNAVKDIVARLDKLEGVSPPEPEPLPPAPPAARIARSRVPRRR